VSSLSSLFIRLVLLTFLSVVVDDGEGQEVTLFSVRAKMYLMEKGVGWKERGGGMLKVNAPISTVDLDHSGVADPSSFDASVLADEDDDKPKHVRLIMRQDHTLRVILNTILLPGMTFQVTNRLKTSTVLFTAFEGGAPRQVQMKVGTRTRFLAGFWANGLIAERSERDGLLATGRDVKETARRCLGKTPATGFGTQPQASNSNNNNYNYNNTHFSFLCFYRLRRLT
jgi:hypothetical protein